MKFGSLFSGIGGLDLGLERAGMKCSWQVEIDDYAAKVLEKHWPAVRRWRDVNTFPPDGDWWVDLICGGFPCQPVSVAGRKRGDKDDRWLWPEFLRVIRKIRPKWVLAENVPGLLSAIDGRLMGGILRDLAESGYDAEWDCIPAAVFGAHFFGERVYVTACRSPSGFNGLQRERKNSLGKNSWGRDEFERLVQLEIQHGIPAGKYGRISDGISNRMDRLKGLGNAVIPQVAEWIGRRIMEAECPTA